MFFSIIDINNLDYPHQSFIQILIQNPFNNPLTLVKGIIGYEQHLMMFHLMTIKPQNIA